MDIHIPKHIEAPDGHEFWSTKTFGHDFGLSCCFRQWRATTSHCRFFHGYALKVRLEFSATELDQRNWVVDFGDFGPIKDYLKLTFDHKTLVAKDDPELGTIQTLSKRGLVQLVEVDDVGCEAFAGMIFIWVKEWMQEYNKRYGSSSWLRGIEVSEHGGNSAAFRVKP